MQALGLQFAIKPSLTNVRRLYRKLTCVFEPAEFGQGDISSFYTCDEGLSALPQEGQATLERLEGMLAQSVAQQYHMAGVQTEQTHAEFQGRRQCCTIRPLIGPRIHFYLWSEGLFVSALGRC